jgi:hypothetical protein
MEKQNITLSLPKMLLKKAKRLAVDEDKSLNELVRQCLEERVRATSGYAEARKRQRALLEAGVDLGTKGACAVTREDLHERP